jgi:tRNA modification GTPase
MCRAPPGTQCRKSWFWGACLLDLTDTAGLRETADAVERLGVERSYAAARDAELVLAVFDGSSPLTAEDEAALAASSGHTAVALVNKSDLPGALDSNALSARFDHVLRVSARIGSGLETLENAGGRAVSQPGGGAGCRCAHQRPAGGGPWPGPRRRGAGPAPPWAAGITPDAALCEVESGLARLGELTGRSVREDITARIFERFCVGK